jgi:CelD/BcsL family acetyltransferase involved in cellulose biosynthesis
MDVNPEKAVKVRLCDNFEQLEPIQQKWDDFVELAGGDIFLTYDWCRIWWKYYGGGRRLQVSLFFDDKDKLVGIIPLFFERIWLGPVFVRAAKIVSSDFTGDQITIPVLSDYIKPVLQRFFESLAGEKWDILHIGPIAGLYGHYDNLKDALIRSFGSSNYVLSKLNGNQTYVKLSESLEKQIDSLSKNQRRTIKRSYKDLLQVACDKKLPFISNLATLDNFEEIFVGFVQMHQSHWQKLGKLGHFADWPDAHNFHFETAKVQLQKNRLRLLQIRLGDCPLGYEYDYKFGNLYYAILNARADIEQLPYLDHSINIGTILYEEQVKNATKENVNYIDMMQGKDEYKLRLGGKLFPIRGLYIIPRRLPVMIRVFIFRILAGLLNIVYHKIWFRRVTLWLKLKPRPLWKIWIRTQFCL